MGGGRLDARAPYDRSGGDELTFDLGPILANIHHPPARADLDADILEIGLGVCRKMFGKGGEYPWSRLHEYHFQIVGLEVPKVAADHEATEFGDGAGHFDARWSTADDNAGEQCLFLWLALRSLCFFEGQKQPMTDMPRLMNAF